MEVMFSQRNKQLYVRGNFKFAFHKNLKDGIQRWKCNEKGCKACIKISPDFTVIEANDQHTHAALDDQKLQRQQMSNNLKRKAVDDICTRPSKLVDQELKRGDSPKIDLSDISLIKRTIRRTRRLTFPKAKETPAPRRLENMDGTAVVTSPPSANRLSRSPAMEDDLDDFELKLDEEDILGISTTVRETETDNSKGDTELSIPQSPKTLNEYVIPTKETSLIIKTDAADEFKMAPVDSSLKSSDSLSSENMPEKDVETTNPPDDTSQCPTEAGDENFESVDRELDSLLNNDDTTVRVKEESEIEIIEKVDCNVAADIDIKVEERIETDEVKNEVYLVDDIVICKVETEMDEGDKNKAEVETGSKTEIKMELDDINMITTEADSVNESVMETEDILFGIGIDSDVVKCEDNVDITQSINSDCDIIEKMDEDVLTENDGKIDSLVSAVKDTKNDKGMLSEEVIQLDEVVSQKDDFGVGKVVSPKCDETTEVEPPQSHAPSDEAMPGVNEISEETVDKTKDGISLEGKDSSLDSDGYRSDGSLVDSEHSTELNQEVQKSNKRSAERVPETSFKKIKITSSDDISNESVESVTNGSIDGVTKGITKPVMNGKIEDKDQNKTETKPLVNGFRRNEMMNGSLSSDDDHSSTGYSEDFNESGRGNLTLQEESEVLDKELSAQYPSTYQEARNQLANSLFKDNRRISINGNLFEEALLMKIVEELTVGSEQQIDGPHYMRRCKVLENKLQIAYKKNHELLKQVEDCKHIIKKLIEEKVTCQNWTNHAMPLRVTRSVGLQVCTVGSVNMIASRQKDKESVKQLLNANSGKDKEDLIFVGEQPGTSKSDGSSPTPKPTTRASVENTEKKPETDQLKVSSSATTPKPTSVPSRTQTKQTPNTPDSSSITPKVEKKSPPPSVVSDCIDLTMGDDLPISSKPVEDPVKPTPPGSGSAKPPAPTFSSEKQNGAKSSPVTVNDGSKVSKKSAGTPSVNKLSAADLARTMEENLPKFPTTPKYGPEVLRPPRPILRIGKNTSGKQGIMLSWNFEAGSNPSNIGVYQLYAYQETKINNKSKLNDSTPWKKVGDINALPLPMACFLTQFVEGHKYHFIVRAVDKKNTIGEFSLPGSITLQPSSSTT